MSQRLFIGIALDDAARAAVQRAIDACNAAHAMPQGLRWLPSDNWHLTLQFLGHVDDATAAAVRDACAATARACERFELELGGSGAFKSARSARVIWFGVSRGQERMAALYDALLQHTEPLGFEREARAYTAHLTLARLKQPLNVEALLPALQLAPARMPVSALTLFRSHLSSRGARYEALASYALGSGRER